MQCGKKMEEKLIIDFNDQIILIIERGYWLWPYCDVRENF